MLGVLTKSGLGDALQAGNDMLTLCSILQRDGEDALLASWNV